MIFHEFKNNMYIKQSGLEDVPAVAMPCHTALNRPENAATF